MGGAYGFDKFLRDLKSLELTTLKPLTYTQHILMTSHKFFEIREENKLILPSVTFLRLLGEIVSIKKV